jgi:cysteine-rich repeat protein
VPFVCGDGVVKPSEACDDGDLATGDGCDAACQVEEHCTCLGEPSVCTTPCGDGLLLGSETCEDGGATAGDGCSDTCTIEPGWACTGAPSVCTPGCGDGTVAGSEECDDGNATGADGCSATCAFEPLCFVTANNGEPSSASVIEVLPDGSLTTLGTVSLNDRFVGGSTVARCGRYTSFNLYFTIAGLRVELDGTLTPIPHHPVDVRSIGGLQRLLCSPDGTVLFAITPLADLLGGNVRAYAVNATTGALTQVGLANIPGYYPGRVTWPDFHPLTGDTSWPPASTSPQWGETPSCSTGTSAASARRSRS